ncbi:MAG: Gfo/Idh/MocA family oxidoreductase [Planctomycetes bacterium]|nr:Gfo/Idh/MocA family oxidoreductase [Planctomycetota bacterium]
MSPRIAVVGCGTHATNNIHPCLAYADCVLDAVCDLDRGFAERNARIHGASAIYTDYRAMLDERKPDGVIVVGPAAIHHKIGMEVLSRGIPLYVEKPTAPTYAQARELVRTARDHGTFLMTGYMKRFGAPYAYARELIRSGEFVPRMGLVKYGHWGSGDLADMLLVMSVHAIDLAIALFGRPIGVDARSVNGRGRWSVALVLRYADDRMVQLTLDSAQPRIQERVEISGTMGNDNALLIVDNVQQLELHRQGDNGIDVLAPTMAEIRPRLALGDIQVWRPDFAIPNMGQSRHFFQGFVGAVREFVDSVRDRRDPWPCPEEALWAMEIVDAVTRRPNGSTEFTEAPAARAAAG